MEFTEQSWRYLNNAIKIIILNNNESISKIETYLKKKKLIKSTKTKKVQTKNEEKNNKVENKQEHEHEHENKNENKNDNINKNDKKIEQSNKNKKIIKYDLIKRNKKEENLQIFKLISSALQNALQVAVSKTNNKYNYYKRISRNVLLIEPQKLISSTVNKEMMNKLYHTIINKEYYDTFKKNVMVIVKNARNIPSHFPYIVYPAIYTPKPIVDDKRTPILYIYPPPNSTQGRDGASMDIECLKIQTLLLFSKYNFTLRYCHEPEMSPSGKLPFLINSEGKILSGRKLLEEVAKFNFETKQLLSVEDESIDKAFSSLVDEKLTLAWNYNKWCDETNFKTITIGIYNHLYPKPLSYILAYIDRKKIIKHMLSKKYVLKDEDIYLQAKKALEAISEQLQDNKFFFGLRPTYLDATLFAHLHIILSTPSQHSELRRLVMQYDNLVHYTKKIWKQYYALPSVASIIPPINENLLIL